MIFYVFNHYFPDSSGFGRRVEREIQALSEFDEVIVVCRSRDCTKEKEAFPSKFHKVKIIRYSANSKIVHRPNDYKGNGLYEMKRNLDISFRCFYTLLKAIRSYSNHKGSFIYSVSSPLTIPVISWIVAKLTRKQSFLVSFHDLEPELAMHIKNLRRSHWIVRVELLLEAFVCRSFKKVLVTTNSQANIISERTGIPLSKICVIPNSSEIKLSRSKHLSPSVHESNDFIVGYLSTLSFDYTMEGLEEFLTVLSERKITTPRFRCLIIGGGEGLSRVESLIYSKGLESVVVCTGHVLYPSKLLNTLDVALIPWKKNVMTETILPTKLFEYLSLGLPVIAPNFGEFPKVLQDARTALLYQTIPEIYGQIQSLYKNTSLRDSIRKNSLELYQSTYHPKILKARYLDFISR